jgi:hypothetical protein
MTNTINTIQPETEVYQNPLAWWGETQQKASTLAKWMALYEAVNIIADKAEEKNISLDDIEFKPLDIRDYMASTEDIYLKKILEEDYNIQVCYHEDVSQEMKDLFNPIEVEIIP